MDAQDRAEATEIVTTGAWIRSELRVRAWSIDTLSYETRIPSRLLWKYLQGTEPGAKNLARIMQAFGYDARWTRLADTRVYLKGKHLSSLRGEGQTPQERAPGQGSVFVQA